MPRHLQVFEHGTLRIASQELSIPQFNALVQFNTRNQDSFFVVGHNRLKFKQYVGVLQVGSLQIEILPKIGRHGSDDPEKWRNCLTKMLREAGIVDIPVAPDANLERSSHPLLDVYVIAFLDEVERLLHIGLTKKYRATESNLNKLKGRIVFRQQIARNLFHQERMFCAHQTYDRDNVFNRILRRALQILSVVALRPTIVPRARGLCALLDDVADAKIVATTFERIAYDRNTECYHRAIRFAKPIILNYSPDLRAGDENIMAILFDMNDLFEKYVLAQLRKAQRTNPVEGISIKGQASKPFWNHRFIRPDIVVTKNEGTPQQRLIILDTKWKVPDPSGPSIEDIRQIFAYNIHYGAERGVLVYPRNNNSIERESHRFDDSAAFQEKKFSHDAGMYFVELFNDNSLCKDVGEKILMELFRAG